MLILVIYSLRGTSGPGSEKLDWTLQRSHLLWSISSEFQYSPGHVLDRNHVFSGVLQSMLLEGLFTLLPAPILP